MAFTYFFRDMQTIELVQKYVVPEIKNRRFAKIWDAGCAHGPEPYSLAIILAENMGTFTFRKVRIIATDIDESNCFGKIISEGVYSESELKRIPKKIFNKYFKPDGRAGYYKIDNENVIWTSLKNVRKSVKT
jgi:chemotaxis protein methyltransferase CheR